MATKPTPEHSTSGAKWQVQLQGASFDLEPLPALFSTEHLRVTREDRDYWLGSAALDEARDAAEANAIGGELVTRLNGAARLVEANHQNVSIGTVARVEGGRRDLTLFVGPGVFRARATAIAGIVVVSPEGAVGDTAPPRPPPTSHWSMLATMDTAVADVLHFFAQPHDWFHLYKLWEIIGHDSLREEWTTKTKASTFTASANHPAVSGRGARHARQREEPPRRRMAIADADSYISDLVRRWLDWRASNA